MSSKASGLDSVLLLPIDLASWVKEREALLIEEENRMFVAARDRAATDEERTYWNELLALRARNATSRAQR